MISSLLSSLQCPCTMNCSIKTFARQDVTLPYLKQKNKKEEKFLNGFINKENAVNLFNNPVFITTSRNRVGE